MSKQMPPEIHFRFIRQEISNGKVDLRSWRYRAAGMPGSVMLQIGIHYTDAQRQPCLGVGILSDEHQRQGRRPTMPPPASAKWPSVSAFCPESRQAPQQHAETPAKLLA